MRRRAAPGSSPGSEIAHVFDVSQTDGALLPEAPQPVALVGEDTARLREPLAERVASARPDIDDAYAVAVLAHELGHIRADHEHRAVPRAQAETEERSIAFIVLAAHGFDSASSAVPCVAGWSGGDDTGTAPGRS
jgi:hypothetical protein